MQRSGSQKASRLPVSTSHLDGSRKANLSKKSSGESPTAIRMHKTAPIERMESTDVDDDDDEEDSERIAEKENEKETSEIDEQLIGSFSHAHLGLIGRFRLKVLRNFSSSVIFTFSWRIMLFSDRWFVFHRYQMTHHSHYKFYKLVKLLAPALPRHSLCASIFSVAAWKMQTWRWGMGIIGDTAGCTFHTCLC